LTYVLLAAAIVTAVIVAAIFVVAWLGRRVRAHNTYLALRGARGPVWVVDEDDEMDDTEIDELMRHAAGDDPEVRITRLEGER
jgi:hypothetical protein